MRMRDVINLVESNSTISKFWINSSTRKIVDVEDEHVDEIGFDDSDEPLKNGWVRGGLSNVNNCYYLEAPSFESLRAALKILLRDYSSADGVYYDIATVSGHSTSGGKLDKRQMRQFIVNGQITNR